MNRTKLNEAMIIWNEYKNIQPKTALLPLLAADKERNRIEALANKIKMNQWTDEVLDAEIYDDFIDSVIRWRDLITVDMLKHGSI